MSESHAFLSADAVYLRPLERSDASDAYLSWLNDPEVLRYRGRKSFPSNRESLQGYIDGIAASGDLVLAVCVKETGRHIGNIALNTILWPHRSAELSIMIGDKDSWGHGYGRAAIELLSAHGFETMGLNRIWAESPNPGFNAIVRGLGWREEGCKREAFFLDGGFVDILCFGRLAEEHFAETAAC